jgi:diadenylate cyclase
VIVVSEETGLVSVAMGGQLTRGVKREELREKLGQIQYRNSDTRKLTIWKGWRRK